MLLKDIEEGVRARLAESTPEPHKIGKGANYIPLLERMCEPLKARPCPVQPPTSHLHRCPACGMIACPWLWTDTPQGDRDRSLQDRAVPLRSNGQRRHWDDCFALLQNERTGKKWTDKDDKQVGQNTFQA